MSEGERVAVEHMVDMGVGGSRGGDTKRRGCARRCYVLFFFLLSSRLVFPYAIVCVLVNA